MESHEISTSDPRNPMKRDERARKTAQFLLRKTREAGQRHIAEYSGISEATVSRWFSENVEGLAKALAYMGVKCVPAEAKCVKDEATLDNLLHWARIGMASVKSADDLFEDEL